MRIYAKIFCKTAVFGYICVRKMRIYAKILDRRYDDHTIKSHDENGILFINIYDFLLDASDLG